MLQALFAGISGLQSHQRRMDVIGNNVANVNTVGFKSQRVTFQDVLYNTLRGAGAPQEERGGTNPMQVGLGVRIGSIDTLFTPGNPQSTGLNTDLMIQGDGLFVVSDGARQFYTRAGNFALDRDGTLVTPGGYKAVGWSADPATGTIDVLQPIAPLEIERGSLIQATATQNVALAGNIDASLDVDGTARTPTKAIYDSLGFQHELYVEFKKTGLNQWAADVFVDGTDVTSSSVSVEFFSGDGSLINPDPPSVDVLVQLTNGAATPLEFTITLDGITQFADETTIQVASQDGFPSGTLERFSFDSAGVITGYYSNGLRRSLGQVALALFSNPAGLERVGETLFAETPNSGTAQIGAAGTGGRGTILPATLEMSNVDLSQEFVDMIVTQRGFQANSRVITTSDEILQELVNLKR